MDDYRFTQLSCKIHLVYEPLSLNIPRIIIPVVIESDLSYSDYAGAGEKLLEVIAGAQPEGVVIRNYQVILRESTS